LKWYKKIRDKIINKALTKKWAKELLENNKFKEIRDNFIGRFLKTPAIKTRIEINKLDNDKMKEMLIEDFDGMVKNLWDVEKITKKMNWSEKEKKKRAIKEIFLINNNEKLGEVLVEMVDEYY